MKNKAIVLLSGGMDSAVTLYIAKKKYSCSALIFDYGQKASREIEAAKRVARKAGIPYYCLGIQMPWKGSALLDAKIPVKAYSKKKSNDIPATYVPARNMIFLSFGVSFAEANKAKAVFIGANQLDYSGYPDCRYEFFESFKKVIRTGTKQGVKGASIRIETPLLDKKKNEIVKEGLKLGVPFEYTWSCYKNGKRPCIACESCVLRENAFLEAGAIDKSIR